MTPSEAAGWIRKHEADDEYEVIPALVELVNAAVAAERERCAKVCEATRPVPGSTWYDAVIVCAAAIRRGTDG